MKILYKIIFLFVLALFNSIPSYSINKAVESIKINTVADPSGQISGNATVCLNATAPLVTFEVKDDNGKEPYTFTYTVNGGASINVSTTGNNKSITVSQPTNVVGTFTYALTGVTDKDNNTVSGSNTVTITVTSLPVADFTFTDNACSGAAVQFTTPGTGSSYTWNFGDGVTSSVKNPTHTFSSLGCGTVQFNVTLTVTDANGCSNTITKAITIYQQPDISFEDVNATSAANQFNNCASASISNTSYTVSVGNISGSTCILSYSINWGDGVTENNVSFPKTHTYLQLGAYNMVVTALGNNGCSNSKTYIVKNVSNPSGGIVSPGSTQNMCIPTSDIQFAIATWATNSPGTTYAIDYGDGSAILNLNQNDMVSTPYYNSTTPSSSTNYPVPYSYKTSSCPNPEFTVTLTVTNVCGFTKGTVANISTISKPKADFTAPLAACNSTNVLFTNTTALGYDSGCIKDTKFSWDFGDPASGASNIINTGWITNAPNVNHTFSGIGTYNVTLSTRNGCGTTTKTQQICIESPLSPQFTINSNSGCSPLAISATNTTVTTNSCTTPNYVWSVTYVAAFCGASITTIPNQTTTNSSFNFTESGTYSIKLTATNSCGSFSSSQTVTVKKPPTAAINPIANYCGPTTINPSAIVNSCAATASILTYAWSFPGGTPATSALADPGAISYASAATYTVSLIVTNECGPSITATKSFTINDVPVLTTTPLTQTICSGSTTALINLTSSPSGATFSWIATATAGVTGFTPSGTNTIPIQTISTTNTSSGTVTYAIKPSLGGCIGAVTNYVISVNPAPTITAQPTSSTVCQGGTPNALSFNLSGATGTPQYQWYSNSTNNTTSGTALLGETNATYTPPSTMVGTIYYYCIISLPTGGCSNIKTNTAIVTIVPNAAITLQPTLTQNLCVGVTIPSPLTIAYSGGTGTADVQWYSNTSNSIIGGSPIVGATSASYTPPTFTIPGNYYYYATVSLNGNGCLPATTNVAEIIVYADPTISSQPLVSQTLCQSATPLNLDISATGGNGAFTYQWYSNMGNSNTGGTQITGATSSSYTPPTNVVGTKYYYCVIIQSSSSGCSVTSATATISVIAAPTITQPASSIICLGGIPTVLSITISGATGTPQYQWYSNINNDTTTGTAIPGEINMTYTPPATTVGMTYYYCIITLSSGGCSNITSNPASVTINTGATIILQPTPSQTLCVGTTISTPLSSTYSGGTGTAAYQWFFNTMNANTGGTLISGATNATYTPLVFIASGNYYYYAVVTLSGNGCGPITTDVAEIVIVADPIVTSQPLTSQTICQNVVPTSLSVTVSGGVSAPYSYQWFSNTGNNTTSGTPISGATTDTYIPPTATTGTTFYYCEITQTVGMGCNVLSATAAITVNLSPTIVSQPVSSTICIGQTPTLLRVSYINGVGMPTYQWYSNSANTIIGSSPISAAVSATYSPPNSTTGTRYYYCIVSLPTGGCSSLSSTIAAVTINPYPVISNKTVVICSGNTFTIMPDTLGGDIVPSGTTYSWTNPNVTPAGSVTGSSAQMTPQTIINQTLINTTTSPAIVTYTVTPLSGACTGLDFTIVVTVNPAITPNVISTNNSCFSARNGSIQTNISGGIPFAAGAAYLISWTGPNGFTSTSSSISSLAPGNYDLSITDAGGCPINETYLITEPDDIVIFTDLEKDITCFNDADGEIAITITGGTLDYTFVWTKNGNPFSNTEDISDLSPGIYEVTVSDANNCGPKTATFTITEPALLTINLVSKTNILCFGQSTGSITVDIVGGTAPYTYAWTGPNSFTSSNQNLTATFAGPYNLQVTDNLGCTTSLAVVLTEIPEISIAATTTPIICYSDNDASIRVVVSGGLAPYQILWSNLGGGTFQDNLSAGDYMITVTDSNNCVKTLNVNIPEAPIFMINPVVKNISCFGDHNGSINLNIVGGIAPLKLTWDDDAVAGNVRNNLGPGSYTVTIVDSKPCTIKKTFIILEPQLLVLSANVTNAFDCDDANSGTINLLVAGGTAPFTYIWSNGMTTEDLAKVPAGNYMVTVTDANGCSKQAQYNINRPPPIVTEVVTETEFNCETKYVKQTFVAQVSGGVPPYQLVWSSGTVSGTNNEMMNTSQNGTAILYVTDAIGCKSNYAFNVDVPKLGTPSYNSSSYAYSSYGSYSINDPIQFTNTATGDYNSVAWDFGDGGVSTDPNPVHTFINPKEYVVTQTVTYPFGCVYVQKITFIVEKGYLLVVPNAFTPNNDNLNDRFRPVTKALKNIHLDIYDSWGSMIYSETGDILRGWDGKIKEQNAENGNYYCKVSGETFYGTIVNVNHPFVLIK